MNSVVLNFFDRLSKYLTNTRREAEKTSRPSGESAQKMIIKKHQNFVYCGCEKYIK